MVTQLPVGLVVGLVVVDVVDVVDVVGLNVMMIVQSQVEETVSWLLLLTRHRG